MSAVDDAIKAVADAVAALEAAKAADVPVTVEPTVDPVRKAVEDVLTGEGWTAPAEPAVEGADPTPEAVTETAESA